MGKPCSKDQEYASQPNKQTLLFWRTHARYKEMLHNGRCTSYECLLTFVPVTVAFQKTTSSCTALNNKNQFILLINM